MERDLTPAVGRRRGPAWTRVGHGLHRPWQSVSDPDDAELPPAERAARERRRTTLLDATAWQLLLRDSASFGHLTGAILRGWRLPPLPDDLPVFVCQNRNDGALQRSELRISRHPVTPAFDVIDGVRVASPVECLLGCARDLGPLDLLVLLDGVLHEDPSLIDELVAAASSGRRGSPALRRTLTREDRLSESVFETLLRELHRVCGIAVEPQYEVHENGLFLARGDLWLVGTKTLHEYDGAEHLERARQRQDLKRGRRLGNDGWIRRGYTSHDVLHQGVGILRDADLTIGRAHDPGRIRAWHALLRGSLFSPAGTEAFRRRIGLPPSGHAEAG